MQMMMYSQGRICISESLVPKTKQRRKGKKGLRSKAKTSINCNQIRTKMLPLDDFRIPTVSCKATAGLQIIDMIVGLLA